MGQLSCKVCGQNFQCSVNCKLPRVQAPPPCLCMFSSREGHQLTSRSLDLSAAVDVYSEWVDACDSVAKENGERGEEDEYEEAPARGRLTTGRPSARDEDRDDDEEDGYAGDGIVADDEY